MSATDILSTNELAVKKWATEDWLNPGPATAFGHMYNRGAIYYTDVFEGSDRRGDEFTVDYTNKLTGIPVGEGGTLDGNEEALNLGNFKMAINVTRVGVLNPNSDTIEQQRTLVDFPSRTRKLIPARLMELVDTGVFYQLAGSNPTSFTLNGTTWVGNNKVFVQGHNTVVAPSTGRIIRAGGVATDQALTSSNTMTLDLIDYAVELNENSDQPMAMFDDGTFDLFMAPSQGTDLKQDTTGKVQLWNSILARVTGGDDALLNGEIFQSMRKFGVYGSVNMYEANRVAYGLRSDTSAVITTVRRAVLVGKDALVFASPFGAPEEASSIRYFSQLKDYDYYKGLEGRMIYGLKKNKASNSLDIGVIVISTYAAQHG
jgi:hypothetical protein